MRRFGLIPFIFDDARMLLGDVTVAADAVAGGRGLSLGRQSDGWPGGGEMHNNRNIYLSKQNECGFEGVM